MDEFNQNPDENNKKPNKALRRFSKLLDKDGFYIILFLCICIVATTAVWVSQNNIDQIKHLNDDYVEEDFDWGVTWEDEIEENQNTFTKEEGIKETKDQGTQESNTKVEKLEEEKQKPQQSIKETKEKESLEEQNITTEPVVSVTSQQKQAQMLSSLIAPMSGKIGMDYAKDNLAYSKTLEQWTTHLGIDILSREGSVVKAVQDGTIVEVKKDEAMGITITIDHGNGVLTRYSNLSTDEMVQIGQKVKKGDPISGVGKGAGFEMAEGPHLHFELIIDGENVNPKEYLPKLTN